MKGYRKHIILTSFLEISYTVFTMAMYACRCNAFVICYLWCRIDAHFVIKITDFGLTEDIYSRNYFRQGQWLAVKLPVKWMAPESLQDGVFSDKTDVVSML